MGAPVGRAVWHRSIVAGAASQVRAFTAACDTLLPRTLLVTRGGIVCRYNTVGVVDGEAASKLLEGLAQGPGDGSDANDSELLAEGRLTVDTKPARGSPRHFQTHVTRSSPVRLRHDVSSPAQLSARDSVAPDTPTSWLHRDSSMMDGLSVGTSAAGTARGVAKIADAEAAILDAIHKHEVEIATLVKVALAGAVEFRLAASFGQQHDAFTPTTDQLRAVRGAALRVVTCVRRWQRRVKHKGWGINAEARGLDISLPRGTPRTPTRDTPSTMPGTPVAGSPAGGLPREDGGEERKDVGTPPPRERLLLTCKGTLPPPFYWNGQATLVALATSLDFLATIPELVSAWG